MKFYDPKQESKHIIYLDANYLYGYAMSKFLPTSGFKWIDPKEFDLNKYPSNSLKECVPEVDKIEIKREILSEHQLKIADLYNVPNGNVKKLVPNLFDKEKYVIHYENLQLYLRLELKLKKVHRVLEFNQSQWLKPYIDFNTEKRIEAEKNNDKDGKALYKLISYILKDAIFGKNNGKLKKQNQCKTSKQRKRLFKIYIKIKLYVTQYI